MLTNEELKNISVLLERTTLNGKEAIAVAQLQLKINKLISSAEESTPPKGTGQAPATETTGTEVVEETTEVTGTE